MRTFCLVLVGIVVGWAASGVDWAAETNAQQMGARGSTAGGMIATHPNNLIEDGHPRTERFLVSSYGHGPIVGCFVVDSMTGRVWHATPGGGVNEVPKGK